MVMQGTLQEGSRISGGHEPRIDRRELAHRGHRSAQCRHDLISAFSKIRPGISYMSSHRLPHLQGFDCIIRVLVRLFRLCPLSVGKTWGGEWLPSTGTIKHEAGRTRQNCKQPGQLPRWKVERCRPSRSVQRGKVACKFMSRREPRVVAANPKVPADIVPFSRSPIPTLNQHSQ